MDGQYSTKLPRLGNMKEGYEAWDARIEDNQHGIRVFLGTEIRDS